VGTAGAERKRLLPARRVTCRSRFQPWRGWD